MYVEVEVIGGRRAIRLNALVDTGFDGYLCLPVNVAVTLGLELVAEEGVEYADGRTEPELLFAGEVRLLGEALDVRIALTRSEQALVGTALLQGCTLFIDFDTNEFRLERKAQQ